MLVALTACQPRGASTRRPTTSDVAAILPQSARIDEIRYADLTGDDRDEILVAATLQAVHRKELTALVLATEEGRLRRALQHRLLGEGWLPMRVSRPAAAAPVAAVFASQAGSGAYLDYIVVQDYAGAMQITLWQGGIFQGRVRFVSEGLLESAGDTDRLYRWTDSAWKVEELRSQYLPPLPPGSIVIPYVIEEAHGPILQGPRSIHARVGQRIFTRRMNPGKPSRILYSAAMNSDAFVIGEDGAITVQRPDEVEISIEGPACSDRILTISVTVAP